MTPQVGRAGLWAQWPGGADQPACATDSSTQGSQPVFRLVQASGGRNVAVLSLGLPVGPAQPLKVTSLVSVTPAVRPGAVWYCQ
jgi:hypothetical protein